MTAQGETHPAVRTSDLPAGAMADHGAVQTDDIAAAKDRIRQRFRAERRAESDAVRARRRVLLAARVDEVLAAVRQARSTPARDTAASGPALATTPPPAVAAFQPVAGEPDICALLNELARRGSSVLLPRPVGVELEWVAADGDVMVCSARIPRPPGRSLGLGTEPLEAAGVGLILVPALAIDPVSGSRVGYGPGFYDRLLQGWRDGEPGSVTRPLLVGVVRPAELVDVPSAPHDIPVDAVLTEDGLARCEGVV
ncbi:MAG: 5-formyltetrahydrofolate cyclo-ligase [Candidatus Nanopelagicales bacterium]|nr:5-formyltetrahydrofolate cyclo-ligase [Candidatus Nanopelagicales bacterium]